MATDVTLAEVIATRRQHIKDSAPCDGCGTTLAACVAERGKDPTAPPWFGCCARGLSFDPCQHKQDPAALNALLAEIEAGEVRTVEGIVAEAEQAKAKAASGMTWYEYFDQGKRWKPNGRPMVRIADMDLTWRFNASRWLERNAVTFAAKYTRAEEVWFAAQCASPLGPSETSQDGIRHELDVAAADRERDPVGWIRTTALYRALVADLPKGKKKLAALGERARHYSTCPKRTGDGADCTCRVENPEPAA